MRFMFQIATNMSTASIAIQEVDQTTDLSGLPELVVEAFNGEFNQEVANFFVNNFSHECLIAVDTSASRVIGCVFLTERGDDARGIGPIAVKRSYQGRGIGGRLLDKAVEKALNERATQITLMQDASNPLTLSLYMKHGFTVMYYTAEFNGAIESSTTPSNKYVVREMIHDDLSAVSSCWKCACGYSRDTEIIRAINKSPSMSSSTFKAYIVYEHNQCVGFTLGINFSSTLAMHIEVFESLLSHICAQFRPGSDEDVIYMNVPVQPNSDAAKWLLSKGMKISSAYNMMAYQARGHKIEGNCIFLPSAGGN